MRGFDIIKKRRELRSLLYLRFRCAKARFMKKFLLFLFSLLIGAALFIWILETVGWPEIKNAFLVFTGWQGIVILFLTFLMSLIGAWKWQEVLKETGVRISFQDIWKAYLASFSIRYLASVFIVDAEIF